MTELASKLSGKRKHTKKVCFPWLDRLRIWFVIQLVLVGIVGVNHTGGSLLCDGFFGTLMYSAYAPMLVLSGFIVTIDLLSEKKRYGSFQIVFFWMRRLLTIVPILLLLLVASFLTGYLPNSFCSFGDGLLMEQIAGIVELQTSSSITQSNLLTWSFTVWILLAVFYFIWPLMMWLVPIRSHLGLEVAFITLSLLFRAGFFSEALPIPYHFFSTILPFMLGALLARQYIVHPATFLRFRAYRKGMAIVALLGGIACLALLGKLGSYTHLYVICELMLMLSALMLIGMAATEPSRRGIDVSFWKEQRWVLPASLGLLIGLSISFIPGIESVILRKLLQCILLIPVFVFMSKSWIFPFLQGLREKYTYSNEK